MDTIENNNTPSLAPIFEIMQGPIRMAVLEAMLELNICDLLQNTSISRELAELLDTACDITNLCYLLDAAVSLGFVEKQKGRYYNSAFARLYLCSDSPTYAGKLVRNLSGLRHKNLDRIATLVRQGPPVLNKEERLQSEEKWQDAFAHLAVYQKAGTAATAADLIESLPEFANAATIMDLGCGPGYICMEVIKRHPDLKGVLFDLPAIITEAQKEVEQAGLASKISTIAGDYNSESLGSGYDMIWSSQSLYYVNDLVSFFGRVYEALNPNGLFISIHEGMTHGKTSPAHLVLSRLSLALEGQDVSFEKGTISESLLKAGFDCVESRPFVLSTEEQELVIARKQRGIKC